MALNKTATTTSGLTATNAYHRVESMRIQTKEKINFNLLSYKDSLGGSAFAIKAYECPYDINGENPFKQAYDYLKTTDEYSAAVNS